MSRRLRPYWVTLSILSCVAALLALVFWGSARPPHIPNRSEKRLTEVQMRVAGLLIALAPLPKGFSDALAQTVLSAPSPCMANRSYFMFLQGNTQAAYETFRNSLKQQGYGLVREVVDDRFNQRFFTFQKGRQRLLGGWGQAVKGDLSTLAFCEMR